MWFVLKMVDVWWCQNGLSMVDMFGFVIKVLCLYDYMVSQMLMVVNVLFLIQCVIVEGCFDEGVLLSGQVVVMIGVIELCDVLIV